jgi:predicted transposase YbfD/YdcC
MRALIFGALGSIGNYIFEKYIIDYFIKYDERYKELEKKFLNRFLLNLSSEWNEDRKKIEEQKKTIKESLLDNMKAKAKELADLYYDGDKTDERNYLYNYIKNALKKGNLSDADQSELEAEWVKLNPEVKPSTTPAGPGSVELYRLGQKGNYTGD